MESGFAAAAAGPERSDAELLAAVRAGDQAAYGVLWSRHEGAARNLARQLARANDIDELVSESFYRVLRAINTGGGPDGAFRAYLLSTLRRVNIDTGRSYYQRVTLTEDDRDLETEHAQSAADVAMDQHEQSAAWRAWASLPESTRTLLWHLVIEEETPAQIASLLGTSPNGVSSRAVRAKERLRQAFLQQHVLDADSERCDWTRRRLGEYVRHALSNRDLAAVDDHLAGCADCTTAAAEVGDVNQTLRVMVAPVVLGGALAASGYLKLAAASHAAHAGAGHGFVHALWHAPAKLALGATGIVAVGATAAVFTVASASSNHNAGAPAPVTSQATTPSVSPRLTVSSTPAITPTTVPKTTAKPKPTSTTQPVSTHPTSATPTTSTPPTPSLTPSSSTRVVAPVTPPASTPKTTPKVVLKTASTSFDITSPVDLPNVVVHAVAPSGWKLSIVGPSGGTCSSAAAVVDCSYPVLAAGNGRFIATVIGTGTGGTVTGYYGAAGFTTALNQPFTVS